MVDGAGTGCSHPIAEADRWWVVTPVVGLRIADLSESSVSVFSVALPHSSSTPTKIRSYLVPIRSFPEFYRFCY